MIDQAMKKASHASMWRKGLCAALVCLLVLMAGCSTQSLDAKAESITVTSLTQLENETFDGFDNLKLLDLRAVSVDSTRVDEIRAALPGCEILWNVALGSAVFDSSSSEIVLPQDCAVNDLAHLQYFPALTRVDATACTVNEAFANAAIKYPAVSFVWNTRFGDLEVMSTDTTLDLTGQQSLSPDLIGKLLFGLPALEQVICNGTGWSTEQISSLQGSYPTITFVYDVDVFGERVPPGTQTLDLSGKTIDFFALSQVLAQLPQLTSVNLTGQQLSLEQMDSLISAFPQVTFLFSFELFAQQVTSETTELDLDGYALTSPEEIAAKLKYLPKLTYCDLSNCGLSNEQMEQLIAQFPSVKFVWMIRIGAWEVRTDITAFSKGNRDKFPNDMGWFTGEGKTNFYNEDIQVLKYCKDLVYLDLGHGNRISDVSVISQLKKLRVLIVSMNKIKDISPLAELKELECLEIYQNPITDISVVMDLPKLRSLNCSSLLIDDITPLLGMQRLKMLWFVHNRYIDADQRQQIKQALPDCRICFSANSSGAGGWDQNDLYIEYQTAFGLPYKH